MTTPAQPATCSPQHTPIVRPLSRHEYELLLRQPGPSYSVAEGWSIGWQGNGWQVFYRGIDASFRLRNRNGSADPGVTKYATFFVAWDWLEHLTPEEIHAITVLSVHGARNQSDV